MTGLSLTAALALLWVGMTGELTAGNLLVGFVLGYLILLSMQGPLALRSPLTRMRLALNLLAIFIWELILANLRVAYDVVTPQHHMRPGLIAVPLDAQTDTEITVLACMVSLTPGTLSVDVSEDRTVLYIHAMYLHDRERVTRAIKDGFERRLLEVLR